MFGEILKSLRTSANLTQAQLGKKLKVSASTIGMYEQNRRTPDIETLDTIAHLFNVSTDFLLGRSENTAHVKHSSNDALTIKDKKDIAKDLNKIKEELLTSEELMFDGHPMSDESIENILSALEIGMEMVRKKNKTKYTPKKYRNS